MQRFIIQLGLYFRNFKQRFDLRREGETAALVSVIKRLYAKMVARHKHNWLARTEIADRKREHAVEALYTIRTFLLVEVDNHLGIGIGVEVMTLGEQFAGVASAKLYISPL